MLTCVTACNITQLQDKVFENGHYPQYMTARINSHYRNCLGKKIVLYGIAIICAGLCKLLCVYNYNVVLIVIMHIAAVIIGIAHANNIVNECVDSAIDIIPQYYKDIIITGNVKYIGEFESVSELHIGLPNGNGNVYTNATGVWKLC